MDIKLSFTTYWLLPIYFDDLIFLSLFIKRIAMKIFRNFIVLPVEAIFFIIYALLPFSSIVFFPLLLLDETTLASVLYARYCIAF